MVGENISLRPALAGSASQWEGRHTRSDLVSNWAVYLMKKYASRREGVIRQLTNRTAIGACMLGTARSFPTSSRLHLRVPAACLFHLRQSSSPRARAKRNVLDRDYEYRKGSKIENDENSTSGNIGTTWIMLWGWRRLRSTQGTTKMKWNSPR